ncbi:MAG: 2-keto-4-pentenoate hydratase [Candidatus Rokuibacteriota bacterium]
MDVKELIAGRDTPQPHRPPSEERALAPGDAYKLQDRLRETLIARGERIAGWKVAFTTRALQEAFNYPEPISGFLLASGVFASGAEIPYARFVTLIVEAEIAFLLRRDLAGPGVTPAQALLAVEGVLPALELPDLRYSGKPTGTDIIADGAASNAIVLGGAITPLAGLDLALEGLVYEHNDVVVATNTGAEVMGNPLNALAWLANHLGVRGLGLRAGDVVMSGSISKLLRPAKGDTVRATYTRLGSVSARFV